MGLRLDSSTLLQIEMIVSQIQLLFNIIKSNTFKRKGLFKITNKSNMKKLTLIISILFLAIGVNYAQTSKHQIGLSISLPLMSYGSYFDYRLSNQQSNTGFLGIGVGLTCVNTNSKNKFSINYELPFIKLISIGNKGGGTLVSVGVIETLISHKIHSNLAVVGGVNFGKYHYSSTTDLYNVQDINETYSTIGLTGGLEYRPSKVISTSLLYRPTIYSEVKTFSSFLSLSVHINLRMSKK